MSDSAPAENDWTYEAAREAANRRLMDQISTVIEAGTAVGVAIASAMQPVIEAMTSFMRAAIGQGALIGEPVPDEVQIVKPAKGYSTWYGWRDGRWAPVHRVKGVGWVWSR